MEITVIKYPRVWPRRWLYDHAKRLIDLFGCIVTLPLTAPLILACALAVVIDSRGPAFFTQERIGKGGRRFKIYKFRTMRVDVDRNRHATFMQAYVRGQLECPEGPQVFKPVSDDQITRVGRFLRKTSIDELPQILNVLRGEMAVVGPRPNIVEEVNAYHPWHHERLEVLPGITGLAQVRGRSCIDFNSLVRFDVQYIERRSFGLDLHILWWTAKAVAKRDGAL